MQGKENPMIELTKTQHLALEQNGGPPRVRDPETNTTYVLVREEVYERMKNLLYDDSELDVRHAYPLMDEAAAKAGWDDPEMDVYNRFAPKDRS
jgi:hypothetical protein